MSNGLQELRNQLRTKYENNFLRPNILNCDVVEIQDKFMESNYYPKDQFAAAIHKTVPCETYEYSDRWLARLSADGHMDCTEWTMFDTEEEALQFLLADDGVE